MIFVDDAFASGHRAIGLQGAHHVITIGDAACGFAFASATLKTAMGLLSKVFEKEAAHCALETDVQFRNLALGHGDNRNALKPHLFEESCDVFLVSADAI